ncbi:MAG: pyridoxal phosphate-dependent aminotransferase [Actinomycetes bacterium]
MATSSDNTSAVNRRISARIGAIAESATLAVDAKAKALMAAGRPVIGFGAGEPDFATPEHIVEAAVAAARDPKWHKYSPTPGLPALRQAIVDVTARDNGVTIAAEQVLVTNGGKQALFNAFASIIDDGDEVLLPSPYWTTYPESIALAGGVSVVVPTDETVGYRTNPAQLDEYVTDRTKALVFVSPSNPTGAVYSPAEIEAIGQWAKQRGIWVISDEIYQHLVYGDTEFASILSLVPDLADTCILVNGVAKTYAMTGWRVGWMIAPADVTKAATNLQSHSTSNVSNVSQVAALAALTGGLDDVLRMRSAFDVRRQLMVGMLNDIPGVVCPTPEGAFYAYPKVTDLLGIEIDGVVSNSSAQLAAFILERAEVAVVPGEAFGTPGYMRLSYALGDDDIRTGLTRMKDLLTKR